MAPKMRTISEAMKWLRESDPETAFTENALRQMIVAGQFPSVRIGKKYLVNLEVLSDFLRGSTPVETEAVPGIRTVEL